MTEPSARTSPALRASLTLVCRRCRVRLRRIGTQQVVTTPTTVLDAVDATFYGHCNRCLRAASRPDAAEDRAAAG